MAVITFRDELRAAVESRHSRFHPFYQLWREGKLSREAISWLDAATTPDTSVGSLATSSW